MSSFIPCEISFSVFKNHKDISLPSNISHTNATHGGINFQLQSECCHRKGKEGRNEGGKEVNLTDLSSALFWSPEDLINDSKRLISEKSDASHLDYSKWLCGKLESHSCVVDTEAFETGLKRNFLVPDDYARLHKFL